MYFRHLSNTQAKIDWRHTEFRWAVYFNLSIFDEHNELHTIRIYFAFCKMLTTPASILLYPFTLFCVNCSSNWDDVKLPTKKMKRKKMWINHMHEKWRFCLPIYLLQIYLMIKIDGLRFWTSSTEQRKEITQTVTSKENNQASKNPLIQSIWRGLYIFEHFMKIFGKLSCFKSRKKNSYLFII